MIVDPLFASLKESMIDELDTQKPLEANGSNFNQKAFFKHFLSKNRPLVIRDYASNWMATKTWGDLDYLTEQAPVTIVRLSQFNKYPWLDRLDAKHGKTGQNAT